MDENTVEVQVDEGSEELTEDVLFDGWDDDVVTPDEDVAEEVTETADQPVENEPQPEETPSVQEKAPEPEAPKTEEQQPDTDQYLELKHLDEVRKVSKDEAKVLAQKGMDYDRIRNKLDEAANANAKLKVYEDFLNEIKGDFNSVEDLMTDTRAKILADKEKISYDDAVAKVKAANQQAEQKAQEQKQAQLSGEDYIQQMKQRSYTAFAKKHPEILPKDIPMEVWEDVNTNTYNLEVSYEKYTTRNELTSTKTELANMKAEIEALKQNKQNEEKAVGSLKTAGSAKTVDKYLEGWDDEY